MNLLHDAIKLNFNRSGDFSSTRVFSKTLIAFNRTRIFYKYFSSVLPPERSMNDVKYERKNGYSLFLRKLGRLDKRN